MEIIFKDHVTAQLQYVDGDEYRIVQKARCSTRTTAPFRDERPVGEEDRDAGLLRSLVRERHGSPFEAARMSWMIEAPIFVAREAVRHRIASWNEESGRYIELRPIFYVPGPSRHLIKVPGSKQMDYATDLGTNTQLLLVEEATQRVCQFAWDAYELMLQQGILKEVARIVLPLTTMTHWSFELNLRALTNFLSLRVRHPGSHIESKPQREIQMLAEQMEHDFAINFPTVWAEWDARGRLPL